MTSVPAPSSDSWLRPLGPTGLTVSAITAGGGPLGSMPETFGYEVAERDAVDLVHAILESPVRTIDTSNGYSDGESERRIGTAIAEAGGLPDGRLVLTKTDPKDGDYSGRRVRESVWESERRLGIGHLPMVFLHDPEFHHFDRMTEAGGAVDTLAELQREGRVGAIGLAGGDVHEMRRYLDLGVFQVLLVHNRLTLVDRSASGLVDTAIERGLGVVNAAIYGGGILAAPRSGSTTYAYRPAHPSTLAAVEAMADVCERHGTDLGTAALQFSLRDARVATTVVGMSKKRSLERALASAEAELPEELWDELEALVPPEEAWVDHQG